MNVLKLAFRLDPKSSKLNYLGDKNHYNISYDNTDEYSYFAKLLFTFIPKTYKASLLS